VHPQRQRLTTNSPDGGIWYTHWIPTFRPDAFSGWMIPPGDQDAQPGHVVSATGRVALPSGDVSRFLETWSARWQPDYPPIKKLHTMVSKRGKRRLVVAAARRLAIDLWRWATGRATAQELGLQFQLTMTQKPSV
jgi:hypothetical protein